MALSEFRDTYSWQGAIELGPHLARLAEELPAAEQMGLGLQLREGMVNLASGIGLDLLESGEFTRRRHAVRLVATLDLIDRVYPALDTATCRDALDKLLNRLASDNFNESKTKPRPPASHEVSPEAGHEASELPHPAPETVPLIAEDPAPPAAPAPHSEPHAEAAGHAAGHHDHEPDHHDHDHHDDDHDHETNPALKVSVSADDGHQEK